MKPLRSLLPFLGVIVAAVALDQWIKVLVEQHLALQEPVALMPFLALYRTYNTGVAFSLFSSLGDKGLLLVAGGVIAFVLYLASRTEPRQVLARLGFALIIGGAVGNVIDRMAFGHVIDYVLFHTPVWSFAVFNLADAFITVGAVAVLLDELLAWRRMKNGGAA